MFCYLLFMPLFSEEKKKEIKHSIIMIIADDNFCSINKVRELMEIGGSVIRWETARRYLNELVDDGLIVMFKISNMYCYSIKNS